MAVEPGGLAALLAAGATVLWYGPAERVLGRRLEARRSTPGGPGRVVRAATSRLGSGDHSGDTRILPPWLLGTAVGLAATVWAGPAAGVVAAFAAWVVSRGRRRRRAERLNNRRRTAVVEACLALAAELKGGQPPPLALSVAATAAPELLLAPSRRAALGGDVASALREQARQPGAESLAAVAMGWEVSQRTGAGLAEVLSRVAIALRADSATRAETEAQLASARATARLLAVLPAFTLLMASGLGGRPVRFLTETPIGVTCLFGGTLLTWAGVTWVDRLARSAASMPDVATTSAPDGG